MKLKSVALYATLAMTLGACKGNFQPSDSTTGGTSGTSSDTSIQFNGGRRVSISGRTYGKTGSTGDSQRPMNAVEVLAIVNGTSYRVSTNTDGGFAFRDLPMRPNHDAADADNLGTVVLYVEKLGWLYDGDAGTAGVQNWMTIRVDAHQEDNQGNFHVDVGPLLLTQDSLKVTSSLVKSNNSLANRWFASNSTVGATDPERGEVYMLESDTAITLQFNMPMDPTYNVNFAELFKTDGTAQAFSGSWDSTGTQYTILPTSSLTGDNNDSRQYLLRIARPVRAFNTWSGTRHELENVNFQFDVLKTSRDTLLSAVTPTAYPAGEGNVGYFFDTSRVLRTGYVASTLNVDVIDTVGTTFCLRFNQNSNARRTNGYRIYARNFDVQNGMWKDTTGSWTIELMGDGTAKACTANILAAAFTNDGKFTYGEQLQLVATPVDNDGNEGPISGVGSPLVVSDNWQPSVTSGVYSKTVVTGEPDNYLSASPTGLLTLNFSESLDPWAAVSSAGTTSISGLLTAASASNMRLTNGTWTQMQGTMSMTFRVYSQTLSRPAKTGDTVIYLPSVQGLKKGFKLMVYDATTGISSGSKTISEIRSSENAVVLTAAMGAGINLTTAATVRLLEGPSGLTSFVGTTTASAFAPNRTISVDFPARFFPNETVNFHYYDEQGYITVGPFTVESVGASTVTLTSGLTGAVPSGAFIADSNVTLAEPLPRSAGAADFTPTNALLWNSSTASSTLAIDNWDTGDDAQPTVLLLASSTGFAVNDLIKIAASSVTNTVTTLASAGDTTLASTGHAFKKNDRIRVEPPSVKTTLAAAVASGATSMTLAAANAFVNGETNVMIADPAFETQVSTAAAAGGTSLVVSSANGLAVGQTITIDSGVEASETKVISAIAGTTLTIPALTNAHEVGARVTRAALAATAHSITASSTGTTVTMSAAAANYSTTATVTKTRDYQDYVLNAAQGAGTVTLPAAMAAGVYFPAGSTIRLQSMDEWRRVTAISGNLVTVSAAIGGAHRKGAAVTKPTQFSLTMAAASMTDFMTGDTVVCDSQPAAIDANNDRFEGTLVDFDTAAGFATFTTTKTSLVQNDADLKCRHMGDAVRIQGVLDLNNQAIRTTWGNKASLQGVSVVR